MKYSTIKIRTSEKLDIPKFKFYEPRRNLPEKSSRKNRERDFTLGFARSYVSQISAFHRGTTRTEIDFAREIPINGFGISDFVVVSWDPKKLKGKKSVSDVTDFLRVAVPVLRAFELKISNWRKALMQASRYKYFANVSIVVLPTEKLKIASNYLATFKAINVGLWGFSQKSKQIISLYTPRPCKPFESKYTPQAIELVSKASKSLPIS